MRDVGSIDVSVRSRFFSGSSLFSGCRFVPAFGFSVYHGKELWRSAGGQTANESLRTAQVVRERLLENWRTALSEAEKSLYPGSATGFRVGERRRLR